MKLSFVIVAACLAVGSSTAVAAAQACRSGAGDTGSTSTSVAPLNATEAAGLAFSRDEERMARDLYRVFAAKYGTMIFTNIASSEQKHFDAVGSLLTRYGVADPAVGMAPGEYASPTVQALYDNWRAQGLTSVRAAYQVGVDLETADIADLQRRQDETSNPDLDRVYGNLEAASYNHLNAFSSKLG